MNSLINEYFTRCHSDYCRIWGTNEHLGMHCGFHDSESRSHSAAVENANRVLADLAGIRPGERVLDAGCGIGGSSFWLAQHRQARVTGISITPLHIDLAKNLAKQKNLTSTVDFELRDFTNTGFADQAFDVVWALESMCYAQSKAAFCREAFRILKPGGRLIIADGFLRREPSSKLEKGWIDGLCECWRLPGVESVEKMSRNCAEIGFTGVDCIDAEKWIRPTSRRMFWLTLICLPPAMLLEFLGLRTRCQTRNVAVGWYQHRIFRKKLGIYGIFRGVKPA